MKTFGAEITKLKNKIITLEQMQLKDENKVMNKKTQELIESRKVTQWKKKPIYYFVRGLRKVALEIDDNGCFFVSSRYPVFNESVQEVINDLLK